MALVTRPVAAMTSVTIAMTARVSFLTMLFLPDMIQPSAAHS